MAMAPVTALEQAVHAVHQDREADVSEALRATHGAILLETDATGRGLLHWAVLRGTDKLTEQMLEWLVRLEQEVSEPGALLSARAPGCTTGPLRTALLMSDCFGDTPLHVAARNSAAMKVYLLSKVDPWVMMWSSRRNNETALQVAVDQLASCPSKSKTSEVLNAMLLGAIESDSPMDASFTRELLKRGAAADTWAPNGLSALMIAAAMDKAAIVEMLVTNTGCPAATTPKSRPAGPGQLLDGADVHLADGQRRTALIHAAMKDHEATIAVLLKHGAQVSMQDSAHKTALDYATAGSQAHVLLARHFSELEAHAQKMAAELLEEEDAAKHVDGSGGDKHGKRKKKRAAAKKVRDKAGSEEGSRQASLLGAGEQRDAAEGSADTPAPGSAEGLAAANAVSWPPLCRDDSGPQFVSASRRAELAEAWQLVETRAQRKRRTADVADAALSDASLPLQQPRHAGAPEPGPLGDVAAAALRAAAACEPQAGSAESERGAVQHAGKPLLVLSEDNVTEYKHQFAGAGLGAQAPVSGCDAVAPWLSCASAITTVSASSERSRCSGPDAFSQESRLGAFDAALHMRSLDDADGSSCVVSDVCSPQHPNSHPGGLGPAQAALVSPPTDALRHSISLGSYVDGSSAAPGAGQPCAAPATAEQATQAPAAASVDAATGPDAPPALHAATQTAAADALAEAEQEVAALKVQLAAAEARHLGEVQDAVAEAVQHFEARVPEACVQFAARLMWGELESTGLAALYCAIVEGAVQPELPRVITEHIFAVCRPVHMPTPPSCPPPPGPPPPPARGTGAGMHTPRKLSSRPHPLADPGPSPLGVAAPIPAGWVRPPPPPPPPCLNANAKPFAPPAEPPRASALENRLLPCAEDDEADDDGACGLGGSGMDSALRELSEGIARKVLGDSPCPVVAAAPRGALRSRNMLDGPVWPSAGLWSGLSEPAGSGLGRLSVGKLGPLALAGSGMSSPDATHRQCSSGTNIWSFASPQHASRASSAQASVADADEAWEAMPDVPVPAATMRCAPRPLPVSLPESLPGSCEDPGPLTSSVRSGYHSVPYADLRRARAALMA